MKLFSRPKIENLDKYLADKDYDKALAAVAAELRSNPRQFNLLLRQAEILGMAGNRNMAVSVYREIAERYAQDGFYAKAIALYKKVVKLDPGLDDVHAELARLIEEDTKIQRPLQEQPGLQRAVAEVDVAEVDAAEVEVAEVEVAEVEASEDEPDRAEREQEEKELEASKLFTSFEQQALERILSSTSLRTYHEGDIIVTEGEEGSSLFLIVSGEVKVYTRGQRGEHIPLAELGPGDFFGEVSLLTGRPRTATITAKSQVAAIELTKTDVDSISSDHPAVQSVLEDFYERRAHDTVEAVIRRMRDEM
jgi:cAMP-dependent protein kinase regulator